MRILLINYRLTAARSSNPVLGLESSMRRQIAGPMRTHVQYHDGRRTGLQSSAAAGNRVLLGRKRDAEPPATLDTLEKRSDHPGHL